MDFQLLLGVPVFLSKLFLESLRISILIPMVEEDHKMQITQQEKNYYTRNREHVLTPLENPQEKKEVNLDNDQTEQNHSSRSYHSGSRGKPSRKEIEEWAHDPYCE